MNGSPMYWIAAAITALYGLASIGGGILGYLRADSVISLVAGGIAGLLLLACAVAVFTAPVVSLSGAIVIALLLLGRFLPKLIKERDELGEFVRTPIGAVTLTMVVGGVLVLLVCALTLAMRATPPSAP